ncbi:MAG: hypothetical protein ACYTFA_06630 [Planctomycetota bacterium]
MFKLTTGLVVLLAAPAVAKPGISTFAELAGGADLIAVGTITSVSWFSSGVIEVDVSEVLFGDPSLKTIRVQKFRNWTCVTRWTPYAADQKLLLFLTAGDGQWVPKGTWEIMGKGNDTGEIPIIGDHIYPSGLRCGWSVEPERHEVYGGTRKKRAPLAPFLAAVRDIRKCFHFTTLPRRRPNGIKQICTDAELADFERRSEIHGCLVKDVRRVATDLENKWRSYMQNYHKDPSYENWIIWAIEVAKGFEPDDPRRAETFSVYAKFLRDKGRHKEAKEAEEQSRAAKPEP